MIQNTTITNDTYELAKEQGNLGCDCLERQEYDLAVEYFTRALEIMDRLGRGEEKFAGWAYLRLGNAYALAGNYDSALEQHQLALEICLQLFGEVNEHTAECYKALGSDWYFLRDGIKSAEYFRKAVDAGDKECEKYAIRD